MVKIITQKQIRETLNLSALSNTVYGLTLREALFRLICSHRRGDKPNIILFCTRRSGSTWILNTLSAHTGMRYVGKPFLQAMNSRHKSQLPSLTHAADNQTDYDFEQFVGFSENDLFVFDAFARKLLLAEIEVYPTLRLFSNYFHRKTDRVVFQVTNAIAMAERLDDELLVQSAFLMRHPISNALSIIRAGWRDECLDFLLHKDFRDGVLTGKQVDLSRRIVDKGNEMERHVLDWCFKNMLPLRAIDAGRRENWLILTYEQTVLDPEQTVHRMAKHFGLTDLNSMLAQIKLPSASVSNNTTHKTHDKDFLIGRWQKQVEPNHQVKLFKILEALGIDAYTYGSLTATNRYSD